MRSMQIDVLLFPGFDELDAIAPYEVLQVARAVGADFQVRLAARQAGEITAGHGLRVPAEAPLMLSPRPDLVVVPGGGWTTGQAQGARGEVQSGVLPALLAQLHQEGTILAAVCTGAMLLAAGGLLHGQPAITHHGAIADLRAAGARVIEERVVDAGSIITAGGVTSGLDLALWIVERFAGAETARQVERRLEYQRRGNVWRQLTA